MWGTIVVLVRTYAMCAFRRKGRQGERSLASYMQTILPYIQEWGSATDPANLWPAEAPFVLADFEEYLRTYRLACRTRLVTSADPDDLPAADITAMYPTQGIGARGNTAVSGLVSVLYYALYVLQ